MTSEIALWNDMSVALAADSATTWGGKTVYNTSEKIYQLAGRQPVGFMTCGLGGYMGVSWDRIFGAYREFLGARENPPNGREAKELPKIQSHPMKYSHRHAEEGWGGWDKDSGYWTSPTPPSQDTPSSSLADITCRNCRKQHKCRWRGRKGHLPEPDDPQSTSDDDKGPRKAPPEWDDMGYVEHFLHFLNSSEYAGNHLSSESYQDSWRASDICTLLGNDEKLPSLASHWQTGDRSGTVRSLEIMKEKDESLSKGLNKIHQEVAKILKREIAEWAEKEFETLSKGQQSEHRRLLRKETEVLNIGVERFCRSHKLKLTTRLRLDLRKLACIFLVRGDRDPNDSASVVIAGFGKEEETPDVVHLEIFAKWDNKMSVRRIGGHILIHGRDRRYDATWNGTSIETFAQTNMIDALLSGRHPEWDKAMATALSKEIGHFLEEIAEKTKGIKLDGKLFERLKSKAKDKKRIKKLNQSLIRRSTKSFMYGRERLDNQTSYAPSQIYRLSPDDLAMLAEELITIEVVFQYTTGGEGRGVGGATDVVSITKEDGLMWIKRKDTFDPGLNPRTHHGQRHRARHI